LKHSGVLATDSLAKGAPGKSKKKKIKEGEFPSQNREGTLFPDAAWSQRFLPARDAMKARRSGVGGKGAKRESGGPQTEEKKNEVWEPPQTLVVSQGRNHWSITAPTEKTRKYPIRKGET